MALYLPVLLAVSAVLARLFPGLAVVRTMVGLVTAVSKKATAAAVVLAAAALIAAAATVDGVGAVDRDRYGRGAPRGPACSAVGLPSS